MEARVGIAVKDLSELQAEQIRLDHCQTALVAFQKKPEYGPAMMKMEKAQLLNCTESFLIEEHSSAEINGSIIPDTARGLRKRFYD